MFLSSYLPPKLHSLDEKKRKERKQKKRKEKVCSIPIFITTTMYDNNFLENHSSSYSFVIVIFDMPRDTKMQTHRKLLTFLAGLSTHFKKATRIKLK